MSDYMLGLLEDVVNKVEVHFKYWVNINSYII
jgi:hypothetical protein